MVIAGKIEDRIEPRAPQGDEAAVEYPILVFSGVTVSQQVDIEGWVSPFARETLVGSLGDGRFRVRSPIHIKFAREGRQFIAEAVEFNEFGFGANRSEALRDLQQAIVELYFTLEREQGRLGADLQKVWETLQEKITMR